LTFPKLWFIIVGISLAFYAAPKFENVREVKILANNRSAKKRIKVSAKRALRNKAIRSRTKTAVKKFLSLVVAGDKSVAAAEFKNTISIIDRAATKGVYHANNAARKKSRLAVKLNKMA
jgi:small subunit ribosomal protein S20